MANGPARALASDADDAGNEPDDGPIVLPRRALPEADQVRTSNRKRRSFARPHGARR